MTVLVAGITGFIIAAMLPIQDWLIIVTMMVLAGANFWAGYRAGKKRGTCEWGHRR